MHQQATRRRWAAAGLVVALTVGGRHLRPFAAQGTATRVSGAYTLTTVAAGLDHPWSLAFLPDGNMLVTERVGRLRVIRNGTLDPQPVAGVPAVYASGV